jgi:hypothetical protein
VMLLCVLLLMNLGDCRTDKKPAARIIRSTEGQQ